MLPEYEEQFRGWTVHISPAEWRGKSFLDVGCGMGRNSFWALRYGAKDGVAVDIDERSLAAARQNLTIYPSAQVLRSSAYDLPFENRFDIVFSIGVIHHLDEPERALRRMARAAKPGGQVLIWVYGYEGNRWLTTFLNPLRRNLFSRLPIALVHHLSLYPAALLWLLLKLRIFPTEYLRLATRFGFAHLRSIVFDQMLPQIAHYWRRDQVSSLMEAAGLTDIRLAWVNQMSWSAIGRRPVTVGEAFDG
jgi:SAM-dependent methyltransferase